MNFRFFCVSAREPGSGEQALNAFLGVHPGAVVHREFVAAGLDSYWSLAVEAGSPAAGAQAPAAQAADRSRIDYREVLPPEQFARFAALRRWRKVTAEGAGVPVYNIFTNEHLAEIVRQLPADPASLGKIDLYPGRIDLGPRARRRFVRKLVAGERRYRCGEWSEAELDAHVGPLLAFVKTADSLGFRRYVLARYGVVT